MSQEPKQPNSEKTEPVGRTSRTEVELFPVATDRKMMAPQSPAVGNGVSRLGTQISIFNPSNFEEALEIVECLRGRAATTITLDKLRKSEAGRLVDFVSGASAALDGDFHKLTEQVYVFCPSNIKIVSPSAALSTKPSGNGALDILFASDLMADKSPRKS